MALSLSLYNSDLFACKWQIFVLRIYKKHGGNKKELNANKGFVCENNKVKKFACYIRFNKFSLKMHTKNAFTLITRAFHDCSGLF